VLARSDRLKARIVRWALPELPCTAMARARALGSPAAARAPGAVTPSVAVREAGG